MDRREKNPAFIVVPVLLPGARSEDMKELGGLFESNHRVEFKVGAGEEELEATHRIATSLNAVAPFPLGRPRMSPFTVRRDAHRWKESGRPGNRDPSILYRGRTLSRAQEVATEFPGQLDPAAFEFLSASEVSEKNSMRRRFSVAVGIAAALAILAVTAFVLKERADENARQARASGLANLANVVRETDATRALRIAELAYRLDPESPAVQQALLGTFYRYRWGWSVKERAPVRAVAVSANGERMATGGYGPHVAIRDSKGRLLREIGGDFRHVSALEFSPDGSHLLVASRHHGARLYTADGALLRTIGAPDADVLSVAFSSNGRSVFIGHIEEPLRRWTLEGELEATYPDSSLNVQDLAVSRDGAHVAAALHDGSARVWPVAGGEPRILKDGPGGWGPVRSVGFVGDGKWLATAHDDGSLGIWKLDGTLLHRIPAHSGTIWDIVVRRDGPRGSEVVTLGFDRQAAVWELPGWERRLKDVRRPAHILRGHTDWVTTGAVTPEGDIVTGGTDGFVRRWLMAEGTPRLLLGAKDYYRFATFHPSNPWVLSGKGVGAVLIDESGALLRAFSAVDPAHEALPDAERIRAEALLGPVVEAQFSGDGARFATVNHGDNKVRIWNVDGGLVGALEGGSKPMTSLCLRSDPPIVVAGDGVGAVYAWDRLGAPARKLAELPVPITGIACAPDGRAVAVTAGNYFMVGPKDAQHVHVLSSDGAVRKAWTGRSDQVASPVYTSDGRLIVPANALDLGSDAGTPRSSNGHAVYLLDEQYGIVKTFAGHTERVRAVAVSPKDRFLLTASGIPNTDIAGGDAAKLWDFDGNLLFEMATASPVVDVSFSADGRHFLTVENRATRLWLMPQAISEWLATSPVDALTWQEQETLLRIGALP